MVATPGKSVYRCREPKNCGINRGKMKFGIFLIGDSDPELKKPLKDYYDEMIEQVQWAEQLGYECFWFGEHHFDFFGIIPSPPVLMSVAAKSTEKIRLGVAVSLLPYRNPLFVAEDYAMVDVISGGRLDFGVGRGTPDEFVGFRVKGDNRDLFIECLDVVEMAWREGKVAYQGNHKKIEETFVNVIPLQRPGPPIFVACLSQASYKFAGERGYPILGIPYATCKNIADIRGNVQFYRDTLEASGRDPNAFDVVQCFHAHVAQSNDEAHKNAREPMDSFYRHRLHIRPRNYDEMLRDQILMVGDPQHCIEQIEEIKATGTNYIIFMMNFATMDQQKALDSMEMMAKEVLPKIK